MELAITAIHTEQAPIFTGVLRDITARKRADETRARLAAIVDSSDDAIFSMSLDEHHPHLERGSRTALRVHARDEMIGQNRRAAGAGRRERTSSSRSWTKAARGEPGEPFETRRMRKDGSLVDISLTISPMTEPGGRVTSLSAIARDITSRKRAEAAVRDERDRAQRYLDTPEVILLALDIDGRITLANRYACSSSDGPSDELLGRDLHRDVRAGAVADRAQQEIRDRASLATCPSSRSPC